MIRPGFGTRIPVSSPEVPDSAGMYELTEAPNLEDNRAMSDEDEADRAKCEVAIKSNLIERLGGPAFMPPAQWHEWEDLVVKADDAVRITCCGKDFDVAWNVVQAHRHMATLLAENLRLMQQCEAYRLELEPLRQRYYYLERDSKPYIEAKEAKEREAMLRRLGWRPKPWWRRLLGR